MQAGGRPDELAKVATLTHQTWRRLEEESDDVSDVQGELDKKQASDIYDESVPFHLPRFQVRAYRRGQWSS